MRLLDGEKAATDALQTASRLSRDVLSRKREQKQQILDVQALPGGTLLTGHTRDSDGNVGFDPKQGQTSH